MPVVCPRRRGVTLIEAVLFISIALGLIVGGIVFYQQASLSQRVATDTRILSAMVAEIQAVSRVAPGGIGVHATDYLIAAQAVPASIVVPEGTFVGGNDLLINAARFRNSFGGAIFMIVSTNAAGDPTIFLTVYDVPIAACSRMLVTDDTGYSAIGRGITSVGSTDYNRGGSGTSLSTAPPLAPSDAGALCLQADTLGNGDGLVDMRWSISPSG